MNQPLDTWSNPQFAAFYQQRADDPDASWYEHRVNFPDLCSMIPINTDRILDFGCGTGVFTAQLSKQFPHVIGTDKSPAMLAVAKQNHPETQFRPWADIERERERSLRRYFFQDDAALCR
ncbi:MAG: class I SAM-dependent methyltransferase [Candidatus Saccharibacteria bacterium]|nr:class I SAM-dependent methyltransferase [Candidatus Saccharibacteria bacterium]